MPLKQIMTAHHKLKQLQTPTLKTIPSPPPTPSHIDSLNIPTTTTLPSPLPPPKPPDKNGQANMTPNHSTPKPKHTHKTAENQNSLTGEGKKGCKRPKESPDGNERKIQRTAFSKETELRPRASSVAGLPIKPVCRRCSKTPALTDIRGGQLTYTCACGMEEMLCSTLTCRNWHLIPKGGRRVTCKCQYTKFYCACDVFHSKPTTDISFVCPNCDESMDPPLSPLNDTKENINFSSELKTKNPNIPHAHESDGNHN